MDRERDVRSELTMDELRRQLVAAGIPVESWGTGMSKTLGHLLEEISNGESILSTDDNGEVNRYVKVACVDVIYIDEAGKARILKEDRQEYQNGHVRRRNLDQSLNEKLKLNEAPEQAAMRAISEEIGVERTVRLQSTETVEHTRVSDSYPGLKSSFINYGFVAVIDDEDFNPEGYVEVQKDKTNYYVWEEMRSTGA